MDKYIHIRKLGQGGNAEVFLAANKFTGQHAAIKCYKNQDAFENAQEELKLLGEMSYPAIPKVHEVIQDHNGISVVMDYIAGDSMKEILQSGEMVTKEMFYGWTTQLCDILSYLHGRNPRIIYRDVKPSNIIIAPTGTVRLIDFGAAVKIPFGKCRTTRVEPIGTVGYAAPEQFFKDGLLDERTDIYALGVTMKEIINSRINFAHKNIDPIINKCIEKEKQNRYRFCQEIKNDLLFVQNGSICRKRIFHCTKSAMYY